MARRGNGRGRGAPIGLAGLVLLAALLTGCTSARSSLGPSDDSCYVALPTAAQAVGTHGRMVGLHLFTLEDLSRQAPHLYRAVSGGRPRSEQVCVVAYVGRFTRGAVSKPLGRPSGQFAVVVAAYGSNELLGTVIFRRVPLHFGRTHIG